MIKRRPPALLLLIASAATLLACADLGVGPRSGDDEYKLDGRASTTMWHITSDGSKQVASGSQRFVVNQIDSTIKAVLIGGPNMGRSAVLSGAAAIHVLPSRPSMFSAASRANDATSSTHPRRAVKTSSFRRIVPTTDGSKVEMVYVEDGRPGDRPPVAVILLRDGKAVAQSEYTYRKEDKRWRPVASRITMFDAAGKATSGMQNDYSDARATIAIGRVTSAKGAFADFAGSARSLFAPDALYAATVCEGGGGGAGCTMEKWAVAGATAYFVYSVASIGIASAGCAALAVPTFGLACAPLVAAHVQMIGADIALGIAVGALVNCLRALEPPPLPVSSIGVKLPPFAAPLPVSRYTDCADDTCAPETWEISYDGGTTWETLGTFWVCAEL